MTTKTRISIASIGVVLLSGCAQMKHFDAGHRIESEEQVSRVDEHSSYPAVRRVNFEQLNLIELIDPHNTAKARFPEHWAASDRYEDERRWGVKYDLVLSHFRESAGDADHKKQHRNSVQDRILGVATSRCNVFKTYLRRQQTEANFVLGSAATVAGVLGAIFTGANAARNLAGTAGILSGIQAEYNQQYYSGLAAHVIVQGIELRQNRMLSAIVKERQALSIAEYSMEAAVKDAILFDGSCSTLTGLAEASESLKESTSPGLTRAAEVIASVRAMHEVANAQNFTELAESGKLQKLLKQTTPASSPLIVSLARPAATPVSDQALKSVQAEARIKTAIDAAGQKVAKAYKDAQDALAPDQRNKTLAAAAISRKFSDVVQAAAASLPIAACVAAVEQPVAEAAKAAAQAALKKDGSPERLNAVVLAEKAKADATLAISRVELLVNSASAAAEATAAKWAPEAAKPDFTQAKLDALTAVAPATALNNLCKAG